MTIPSNPAKGCVIAAPHSGAGKTLFTLGLIRALKNRGLKVASAKAGPDFIDPAFHQFAGGTDCLNLDLWAMGKKDVQALARDIAENADTLIIEGVMGLFDGADNGFGSTAHLAKALNLPVILVVDASRQSWSVAALVHGFLSFDSKVQISGVICNQVASERHADLLTRALEPLDVAVLGMIPRQETMKLPSRHLGLVQAEEHSNLENFMEEAARTVTNSVDLDALLGTLRSQMPNTEAANTLPPLGQHIAIAKDEAFAFFYPHLGRAWQKAGATLSFFSPLKNEAPAKDADAIFLPGGYPELHAGRLADARHFLEGLQRHQNHTLIYGECGGFMVMGEALIDKEGVSHPMAGLLPVVTSFQKPKRTLGYREVNHTSAMPWPQDLRAHEFHYSSQVGGAQKKPLFKAKTAEGKWLPDMGVSHGLTMGSYAHILSPMPEPLP